MPAGSNRNTDAPRFSQSQGKKQPMISHSAVAKKSSVVLIIFCGRVSQGLDIIRDNKIYFSIPDARVCRERGYAAILVWCRIDYG
ncbi:hypothetical protein D3C80_1625680 [compost metagenome]